MKAIISVGTVITVATVNGRETQMMSAKRGGPVRRTHPFQTGITGGTTVNTMIVIMMMTHGIALMTSDKARTSSTLQMETSGRNLTMVRMRMKMITPPQLNQELLQTT